MAEDSVAGISFDLSFDSKKLVSGINDSCAKIKAKFEQSFSQAAQKSTEAIKSGSEDINRILGETERSAKSKAAAIAAIYKREGYSSSDAFKEAWKHIERESQSGSENAKKSIKGIGDQAKKTSQGMDDSFSEGLQNVNAKFSSFVKKIGAALAGAFAVKKIVDFGKQCLELGSDLTEVENVVDVTFPHMTAQADEFAKKAIHNFGLSETMAKQYSGTYGAMAKAFGFTEKAAYDMGTTLAGLSGDVASFYNLNQSEAYTKLKSVFTGETESLKDLG